MIHVIGDSHCCIFSGQERFHLWDDIDRAEHDLLPEFRTYRLGPVTAYQFERKVSLVKTIANRFVLAGDILMPCCGEVDCRAHLLKQAELQGKSPLEVVNECALKYFGAILALRDHGIERGFTVAVWGPIASFSDSITYDGPFQADCETRNHITELFTEAIRSLCREAHIPFGSIYRDMIDKNQQTDPSFITSSIHLGKKGLPFIYKECKRIGLIKANLKNDHT